MATVIGELKKWHTVTLEFTDTGETYTETGATNPFLDRRLNVTFTSPTAVDWIVPGYFAADGDAAETSAVGGNIWHCKFSPDEEGLWTYTASFREGVDVAVTYPSSPTDGTANSPIDGDTGNFTITANDKTGRDFRAHGRLQYDSTRYPKFAETGAVFIKSGVDSPENLLGFNDFDDVFVGGGTDDRKDYATHVADWTGSDPVWQTTKGKGLVGAINYLSGKGLNSISFLTMAKNDGDSQIVTTYVDHPTNEVVDFTHFDVSRLAQWEIVFTHAQEKGMFLHFKTQEQENAAQLNGGSLGTERKLYYRELVARFGHHLVLNWNMGEENEGNVTFGEVNSTQRIEQLAYVADIDPYGHLRVAHSKANATDHDAFYPPLIGGLSEMTGVSLQALITQSRTQVQKWIDDSVAAGKPWALSLDETANGIQNNQFTREKELYQPLFAGAYGVEWYRQGEDQTLEDFRSGDLDVSWDWVKYALDFMALLPVTEMNHNDGAIDGSGANSAFVKDNDTYAIYLRDAIGNHAVTIPGSGDTFTVKWFDPRNGGALQDGTVTSVTSNGGAQNIGTAPNNTTLDWVVLITNDSVPTVPSTDIVKSYFSTGINTSDEIVKMVIATSVNTVQTVFDNTGGSSIVYSQDWEEPHSNATDDWTFLAPGLQPLVSSPTNARWVIHSGETPTSGRGPSSAQGGTQYVYTEGSGSATNDIWLATFDPIIDASVYDVTFDFYTNQRGDQNDMTCNVQTNENGAGWVTRFTCGGASDPTKVASDGVDVWVLRQVDLTGIISDASTLLRIQIVAPASGTSSHFDYGLDTFVVTLSS